MDVNELIELIKNDSLKKESIGTQKEKSIHQFIKYYLSTNVLTHEVSISGKIVDVFVENAIYEVQTRSFYKLRDKLSVLLNSYKLTICFPIYCDKIINFVDEDGVVTLSRISPKKELPCKILSELYAISSYLTNPNLSLKIFLLSVLELQTTRVNKYKKIKRTPIDKLPLKLYDVIDILSYQDIIKILPSELFSCDFSASDFKKITRLSERNSSYALQVLKKLNLVTLVKKEGRKFIYTLNKRPYK